MVLAGTLGGVPTHIGSHSVLLCNLVQGRVCCMPCECCLLCTALWGVGVSTWAVPAEQPMRVASSVNIGHAAVVSQAAMGHGSGHEPCMVCAVHVRLEAPLEYW